MRKIDDELRAKYESALQTAAADADPSAVVWISRPTVPLTDPEFLDSAAILDAAGLTACDVAVRRPRADREADRVYVAYIDENGAHVKFSATQPKLRDYVWTNGGFSSPEASDVAIAFDGTMPQKADGSSQFVTELSPWVFWITGGVLRGRILGLLGETVLASANAGRVSAVRAAWAPASNVDFGLVVFFTLSGALYYRQLIGGEWMDAMPVTFGPSGVTWTDIRAFRTWDYRVGVQALGSDGKIYELFTQFQGIAKHAGEHIELSVRNSGSITKIWYHDVENPGHISLAVSAGTGPYGGFYQTGVPSIVSAYNSPDQNDDWGHIVIIRFDRHIRADEVAAQYSAFSIVDSRGTSFVAQSATLGQDGMTVTLTFQDFNSARGQCAATYTPGTVNSMASVALESTSFAFTPQNLVAPVEPAPEVYSLINVGYEGAGIYRVRFYSTDGQTLLYTEFVYYGDDCTYGTTEVWAASANSGTVSSGITENITASVDVYLARWTVKYYNRDGTSLKQTEYVLDGEDAAWGAAKEWAVISEGPAVPDILDGIHSNLTLYAVEGDYETLEYLAFSGGQYFTLRNIAANSSVVIESDVANTSSDEKAVCGYRGSGTSNSDFEVYYENSTGTIWARRSGYVSPTGSQPITVNVKNTFSFTLLTARDTVFVGRYSAGYPYPFSGRLYSIKVSVSGTPVMDIVPCRRTADDVLGFYDSVNDVFYTNEGSGSWTAPA